MNFGITQDFEPIGRCGELVDGIGQYDTSIRLADINGDKKADVLCVERNGRTLGHVSQPDGGYRDMGQVKKPEGADRANVRFVDVSSFSAISRNSNSRLDQRRSQSGLSLGRQVYRRHPGLV